MLRDPGGPAPGVAHVHGAAVPAEESGTGHWFEGVERGTETPEVAHAPPPDRRLRQPDRLSWRAVRLAQSTGPARRRRKARSERLCRCRGGSAPPGSPPKRRRASRAICRSPAGTPTSTSLRVPMVASIGWWSATPRSARCWLCLAQTYHLNIVAANDIDAVISITLRDVALEEALTAILSVANYTWVNRDGIILITSLSDTGSSRPRCRAATRRSSSSTSCRPSVALRGGHQFPLADRQDDDRRERSVRQSPHPRHDRRRRHSRGDRSRRGLHRARSIARRGRC